MQGWVVTLLGLKMAVSGHAAGDDQGGRGRYSRQWQLPGRWVWLLEAVALTTDHNVPLTFLYFEIHKDHQAGAGAGK